MTRVLLMGYFGAGNFGDDALLVDWLLRRTDWLKAHRLQVDVITNGQDTLSRFVEGEALAPLIGKWIPKRDALRVAPAEYQALIAPGGSLLQDATSLRSLLFYLAVVRRFTSRRRKVFLLNQGIGPLSSWLASVLTPWVLGRVTMLTLRDEQSYRWALEHRALASHPAVLHSADPVLSARFAAPDARRQPELNGEYALVIAKPTGDLPTPMDPTPEAAALARLIDHSQRTTGLPHYLLPLQSGPDLQFCQAVARETGDSAQVVTLDGTEHSASSCHSLIGGATIVISYRLHGLVTAAASNDWAFGVAYDPKVAALCQELALPYCFPATVHEESTKVDLARYWRERAEAGTITAAHVTRSIERHAAAEERFDELWN